MKKLLLAAGAITAMMLTASPAAAQRYGRGHSSFSVTIGNGYASPYYGYSPYSYGYAPYSYNYGYPADYGYYSSSYYPRQGYYGRGDRDSWRRHHRRDRRHDRDGW
jgi:hypothetical protein